MRQAHSTPTPQSRRRGAPKHSGAIPRVPTGEEPRASFRARAMTVVGYFTVMSVLIGGVYYTSGQHGSDTTELVQPTSKATASSPKTAPGSGLGALPTDGPTSGMPGMEGGFGDGSAPGLGGGFGPDGGQIGEPALGGGFGDGSAPGLGGGTGPNTGTKPVPGLGGGSSPAPTSAPKPGNPGPNPAKPKPALPKPAQPTPVKPAPVKPAPAKPKPVVPVPVKPKPVKPAPGPHDPFPTAKPFPQPSTTPWWPSPNNPRPTFPNNPTKPKPTFPSNPNPGNPNPNPGNPNPNPNPGTPNPGNPGTGSAWLQELNRIRTSKGLNPVVEDTSLSAECVNHVAYMKIHGMQGHFETPGQQGYSAAGHKCAKESNLVAGARNELDSFRIWVGSPAHYKGMVRPGLKRVGFAYGDGFGALNVIAGLN